jgi:hypothetical protein
MAAMIGKASLELDWVHHATSRSEEIRVFATLFPQVCSFLYALRFDMHVLTGLIYRTNANSSSPSENN